MNNTEPRTIRFCGLVCTPSLMERGTWLEAEEAAYPSGGFTRRARAICPDGRLRVVQVSIPDTYSSIPARLRLRGKTFTGWVGVEDNVLRFHSKDLEKEIT